MRNEEAVGVVLDPDADDDRFNHFAWVWFRCPASQRCCGSRLLGADEVGFASSVDVGPHLAPGVDGDPERILTCGVLLGGLNPGAIGVPAEIEARDTRGGAAEVEQDLDVHIQIGFLGGVDGSDELPVLARVAVVEDHFGCSRRYPNRWGRHADILPHRGKQPPMTAEVGLREGFRHRTSYTCASRPAFNSTMYTCSDRLEHSKYPHRCF